VAVAAGTSQRLAWALARVGTSHVSRETHRERACKLLDAHSADPSGAFRSSDRTTRVRFPGFREYHFPFAPPAPGARVTSYNY